MSEPSTSTSQLKAEDMRARIRRRRLTGVLLAAILLPLVAVVLVISKGISSLVLEIVPEDIADQVDVERNSGMLYSINDTVYMYSDKGEVTVSLEGYRSVTRVLEKPTVDRANRYIEVELEPLPGIVSIVVNGPTKFEVSLNGEDQPREILQELELSEGEYQLVVSSPSATTVEDTLLVKGFGQRQEFVYDLLEALGELKVVVEPPHASITIDGVEVGKGQFDGTVAFGEHEVRIHAPDYVAVTKTMHFEDGQEIDLGQINLAIKPAYVTVETNPRQANILIDGMHRGESGARIEVQPNVEYALKIEKSHYHSATTSIQLKPGEVATRQFELRPVQYPVAIRANVPVTVFQNGIEKGTSPLQLNLELDDVVEVRQDGYRTQSVKLNPDEIVDQKLSFEMLSPIEHAMREAPPQYISPTNLVMVEFPPLRYSGKIDAPGETTTIAVGVDITRPFYLSKYEIRYRDFLKFEPKANSDANPIDTPITAVTWVSAVRFCNWLSKQEGYAPVYRFDARGTVSGVDTQSLGYRLPTELEWEAAHGYDVKRQRLNYPYPWGASDTIPRAYDNFAGRELWRESIPYLQNHVDNSVEVADTGSYPANVNGIHDMAGNVSEWVHDFYAAEHPALGGSSSMGPSRGFDHVVKGANFRSSSEPELRTSHREIGPSRSDVVGFRVARWIY